MASLRGTVVQWLKYPYDTWTSDTRATAADACSQRCLRRSLDKAPSLGRVAILLCIGGLVTVQSVDMQRRSVSPWIPGRNSCTECALRQRCVVTVHIRGCRTPLRAADAC